MAAHAENDWTRTRTGRRDELVKVRVEQFVHTIDSAAADLRRSGQAVSYENLARYTDMPEYLIRKVVDLPAAPR